MMGEMDWGVKIVKMTMKTTVMKMGMTRVMTMRSWATRTIEIMMRMRSSSRDEKKLTDF